MKVNLNQLSLDMAKDFLEQKLTPKFLFQGLFLAYSVTPNGLVTNGGRLLAATPFVRKILTDAWKYGGKKLMSPAIDLALEHFNDRIGSNEEMLFKIPKAADKNKDKLSPNSSGSSSSRDPEDPDEEINKDAKKFKLNPTNGTDRKILDNIDKSAQDFISKNRRGKVLQEFPGQYLNKPLRDILQDALEKNRAAITARKLLIDGRFLK